MFEEREFTRAEAYELRLWLANFSQKVKPEGKYGHKVVYRFGRLFGELKKGAEEWDSMIADLRVKHGEFKEGNFTVDTSNKKVYDAFQKDFEALKNEKVKIKFLSEPIEAGDPDKRGMENIISEELSGVEIGDYDYLHLFFEKD